MKIAYLLFAYKNPKLIQRTIECLADEDCSFFVHIDAKIDIAQFASIRSNNVHFTNRRILVGWAEFSGVEAILLLIREALAAPQHHDYFVLLSGSEYPVRSREYIQKFLQKNRGQEFITMSKMPAPGKPLSRINTLRYPTSRPVLRFLFRVLAKFGLAQRDYRKHLGGLEPYAGITWWTLSREACQYVVDFKERDQILIKFLENTFAPEESYIHTVLGNSPFKQRARRNLLFEDWTPREKGKTLTAQWHALPALIDEAHCEFFESKEEVTVDDLHGPGEMLFARKFSDDHNLHLIPRIDEMIQRKEREKATVS